jgi:hypothetical protein
MRRTPRSLADVREELEQIQEEFTRLQKRIEAVRESVGSAGSRFCVSNPLLPVRRFVPWPQGSTCCRCQYKRVL